MFLSTPSLDSKDSLEDIELHLLQALNFSQEIISLIQGLLVYLNSSKNANK